MYYVHFILKFDQKLKVKTLPSLFVDKFFNRSKKPKVLLDKVFDSAKILAHVSTGEEIV